MAHFSTIYPIIRPLSFALHPSLVNLGRRLSTAARRPQGGVDPWRRRRCVLYYHSSLRPSFIEPSAREGYCCRWESEKVCRRSGPDTYSLLYAYFTRRPPLDFALVDPLQHMDDDLADAPPVCTRKCPVPWSKLTSGITLSRGVGKTNKQANVDTVDVQ
jgi:hypothetical protein